MRILCLGIAFVLTLQTAANERKIFLYSTMEERTKREEKKKNGKLHAEMPQNEEYNRLGHILQLCRVVPSLSQALCLALTPRSYHVILSGLRPHIHITSENHIAWSTRYTRTCFATPEKNTRSHIQQVQNARFSLSLSSISPCHIFRPLALRISAICLYKFFPSFNIILYIDTSI